MGPVLLRNSVQYCHLIVRGSSSSWLRVKSKMNEYAREKAMTFAKTLISTFALVYLFMYYFSSKAKLTLDLESLWVMVSF